MCTSLVLTLEREEIEVGAVLNVFCGVGIPRTGAAGESCKNRGVGDTLGRFA